MPDELLKELLRTVPWLAGLIAGLVVVNFGWKWVVEPIYDKLYARGKDRRLDDQKLEELRTAGHVQLDRILQLANQLLREFQQERNEMKAEQRQFLLDIKTHVRCSKSEG